MNAHRTSAYRDAENLGRAIPLLEQALAGQRAGPSLNSVGNLGIWLTAVTPGASLAGT